MQEMSGCVQSAIVPIGTESERRCPKCGITKAGSEYYKDKNRKDGLGRECKHCVIDRSSVSQASHREERIIYLKKWRAVNQEKTKEYTEKRKKEHAVEIKEYEKRRCTLEKRKDMVRRWNSENPERKREHCRKARARYCATPKGRLHASMKSRMNVSLSGRVKGGRKWEDLVGYSTGQLKRHLEKQFQPGMTWDNYGEWHMDHIIPVAAFNFGTPDDLDFKRCWALKNLQPLWASENMKKNKRLDKPFQPSLRI